MDAAGKSRRVARSKVGVGPKACAAHKQEKQGEHCNKTPLEVHCPRREKECEECATKISDKALFAEHPKEDCPICRLPMAVDGAHWAQWLECCGKTICIGCLNAICKGAHVEGKEFACPYCRTPVSNSNDEKVERVRERMKSNDAMAFHSLANVYFFGDLGLPEDKIKALKLWRNAAKLGCARANKMVGRAYFYGEGVDKDTKMAKHHFELAAMGGSVQARHRLGDVEFRAGNVNRSMKHFMISAKAGVDDSLAFVRRGYESGDVTKAEFALALRGHHESQCEMKSDAREEIKYASY